MRQLAFVPFSAFSPDGPAHGPGLDRAENVIPVHGGYRSLEKAASQSRLAFTGELAGVDRPTGLFVHMFSQSRTGTWARPSADDSAGIWAPSEGSDLWAMLDETLASDSDRIIAGGAPSAAVAKIQLSTPPTPGVDTDHLLRWRYAVLGTPSGAWSVKVELMEGAAVVGGGTPVEETKTGSADEAFVSSEIALSSAQAATITDYSDLYLRFTATVPGAGQFLRPDADDSVGGWTTNAGASANLYQAIDETSASEADYIRSGLLPAGGSQTYRATLSAPTIDPRRSSGHIVRYRYYAEQAGMTLVVKLKQGTTEIASNTHAAITAGSWIAGTFTLSAGETDAVTEYGDLLLEAVASFPTAITPTQTQIARPTSDIVSGSWRRSDTQSYVDVWAMVDEATLDGDDFAEYFYPVAPQIAGEPHEWGLSALSDPLRHDEHEVYVAVRSPFNDSIAYTVKLKQSAATIASWDFDEAPVSGSLLEKELAVTSAQAANITDYAGLSLEVTSSSVTGPQVYMVEFRAPSPARLRLSWAELEIPSSARAEISWAELEVPAADAEYQGDVPTIYLGKKEALYVVDSLGFEDVSIAAGYGGGGTKPGGWYFTSWGNDTIATNYVDPVQIRRDQTGDFADMITSTLKPKGRFVMVVRNHVVLLDINLTGHAAHEVWWSAFEDETDFDPDLATRSDFQPLLSTQGQIMGGVGGEYGVIFKRNAIHIMTATGTSSVFRFDEVSRGIGTPFPRSIVRAEGMIYFWDGSTFRRTTGFEQPERVGWEVLSRFLTDARFEEHPLRVFEPENILEEDQAMVSAYDSSAGVITWSYASPNELGELNPHLRTYQKRRKIHYSPSADAWSFSIEDERPAYLSEASFWIADLAQVPNVSNSDTHLLKGTIASYYQPTELDGIGPGGLIYSGFTGW